MRILVAAVLAAILAGCASDTIIMKNDATGALVQCGGKAAWGGIALIVQEHQDQKCVRTYEAEGYRRLP